MDVETEDCELDEIVEGECFRLGAGVPPPPLSLSLSLLQSLPPSLFPSLPFLRRFRLWLVWSARGNAARKKEGGGIGAKWKQKKKKEREKREEAGMVRGRGQRALWGKEREEKYVISNKRRGDRS